MKDWIKNLKVGDKVFIDSRWGSYLRTVEKISSAGNIKVNGIMFNTNGCERGGDAWSKSYLSEATPEKIADFRREGSIRKALKLMRETKQITYEKAVKIIEILESEENVLP